MVYVRMQNDRKGTRALCYVLSDFNDTYYNLLQRASKSILYIARLRILAIEILSFI